jgi:hypothetical protein
MIVGYISIGKFAEADARIAGAMRIARDAGWDYAAVEIGNQKALSLVYQGQLLKAEAMHRSAAEQYRRLDDIENADYNMLYAMRAAPGRLGVETMRRRERLGAIIERARRQGSVNNELEALQLLARIDRGNAVQWDKHIRRMRALGDTALTPDLREQNTLYVLDEYKFSRRYRAVLDGLQTVAQTDSMDARIWRHLLLIESFFARDELPAAVAEVRLMERDNIDLLATGSTCQFAWLFAEAGIQARARELLRQCADQPFDRMGQAIRGDFAFLAEVSIHRSEGLHADAWRIIAPRIACPMRSNG